MEKLEQEAREFNAKFPVGTKVRVCKGSPRHGDPWTETEIIEPGAFVMGGHSAVVKIPGDAIRLSHVVPVSD